MSGAPEGFAYTVRGAEVTVTHHGRRAVVLRGTAAQKFLDDVQSQDEQSQDEQQVMARATGNYRRGNERQARNHLRNR